MPTITVTLTGDAAERLERLVRDRVYDTPAQAVEEALAAFDDDAPPDLEGWLKPVVTRRIAALDADPASALTMDDLRAKLFGPA
jgi:Arc/MetJ-type ribon-helix-helix transcriptional regulator